MLPPPSPSSRSLSRYPPPSPLAQTVIGTSRTAACAASSSPSTKVFTLSIENSKLQSQLEALGGTSAADLLELNFEKDELLKTKDSQLSSLNFEVQNLKSKLKSFTESYTGTSSSILQKQRELLAFKDEASHTIHDTVYGLRDENKRYKDTLGKVRLEVERMKENYKEEVERVKMEGVEEVERVKEVLELEGERMKIGLEAAGRMKEGFKVVEGELRRRVEELELEVEQVRETSSNNVSVVEKIVEKVVEVEVEVPVEVIVERVVQKFVEVEVPVEKIVERVVEKIVEVEVPVEKIVERVVEKIIEVPVEVPVERVIKKVQEVEVEVSVRDETTENDLRTKIAVLETTCDAAVQEAEALSNKLKAYANKDYERKLKMLEDKVKRLMDERKWEIVARDAAAAEKDGKKKGISAALHVKLGRQKMAMKRQLEQAKRLREVLDHQ
ncbi:hypothetical protein TrLO_g5793 [Triparma laevis f. longispina]|uniref:Uncharacterized protein n=1 Tax=Triparma laevis f. longispina TaxID=1714387 RepID=A0A9W6ZIK9_9STRA|nr:hypothetical protein TrLO_g5793 [Triparma laevis f. longispina]